MPVRCLRLRKKFFSSILFCRGTISCPSVRSTPILGCALHKKQGGTSLKPKVFSLRVPPRFVSSFVPPTLPPCFPISNLPYPASLLFAALTKTARCQPTIPISELISPSSTPHLVTSLLHCFPLSRFPALIDTRAEAAYLSAPMESFAQ